MFHKKCGINISLNLNNTNYFYGKFYYSISKLKVEHLDYKNYDYLFWGFTLLKFEYNRCFYLNCGKIKSRWSVFKKEEIFKNIEARFFCVILNLISIEIGLNIIVVNDWRKKK